MAALLSIPTTRYNERRSAPRARSRFRVDCFLLVPTPRGMLATAAHRCTASDISTSGIFLRGMTTATVGSRARLILRLPDDPKRPLICYARVTRIPTEGGGVGLELQNLGGAATRRLRQWVVQALRWRA